MLSPNIFREYDIRGIVGKDLTDEAVALSARAFGTILRKKKKTTAVIGRDVRHSSTGFAENCARELNACGIDVLDCGIVPTPVLYYAIMKMNADGGIMITGSHNPIEYNGLKVCEGGLSLYGDEIQEIRRVAESGGFERGAGRTTALEILPTYRDDLLGRFKPSMKRKIVVDCGNGVAGPFIPDYLRRLGHEVIELYTEPDGSFPNHLPDPEVAEYMKDLVKKVKETGAHVGFGFDGDADRLGVIDENGRKISADWLIAIFARDLLQRHPGGKIRYDVKCTDFLDADVRKHGGVPIMGRTGHSILKRDVKNLGAILGGELSGHICFGREYYIIDDPFFCAMKVLELMEKTPNGRSSELFHGFPQTFSTAEIKAGVPEDKKFRVVDDLKRDFMNSYKIIPVDGVRVVFEDGWGLVRASNTTANLTVRFEARSIGALEKIRGVFLEKMGQYPFIDLENVKKASVS